MQIALPSGDSYFVLTRIVLISFQVKLISVQLRVGPTCLTLALLIDLVGWTLTIRPFSFSLFPVLPRGIKGVNCVKQHTETLTLQLLEVLPLFFFFVFGTLILVRIKRWPSLSWYSVRSKKEPAELYDFLACWFITFEQVVTLLLKRSACCNKCKLLVGNNNLTLVIFAWAIIIELGYSIWYVSICLSPHQHGQK